MNNQTKIGMVGAVVAFMLLLVWMFSGNGTDGTDKKKNAFVSSNWNRRYQIHDKTPLGLYLFTTLSRVHIGQDNEMLEVYDKESLDSIAMENKERTYFFTGYNFGLTYDEMDTVMEQVYKGSDLFLSFNELTENIYDELPIDFGFGLEYDNHVNVYSRSGQYRMIHLYQNDTIAGDWWAFNFYEEDSSLYTSLSSFMEMDNFVKVPYGDGMVYLHTNPSMFYNYQLKRNDGYRHTEFVLNQIDPDKDIVLMELGRLAEDYGTEDVDFMEGPGAKKDDSYLQLIFRSPQLLTALLLSILGLILFVAFRSKRTRPIVPFIQKKKDMTMAFAETITSIYFSKRNPYGLLQVQRKNFYETMQKHFFVDLFKREDDKPIARLAEKTDTSVSELSSLINKLETKEAFSVDEVFITDTLSKIRKIYRSVGIISDDLKDKIEEREMTFQRALVPAMLFILFGITIIIYGLYYLTLSIGIGIVFWPLGMILLVLGILRLRKPYLRVEGQKITYYSALGFKKIYDREDLTDVLQKKSGVILKFRNNKQLIINYWDLSRFDAKQFKKLVSKLNTLKL